jgi:hypothetical protein
MFTKAGWASGMGGWAGGVGRALGTGLGEGLGMGAGGTAMMGSVGAAGMAIALPMAVGYAVTSAIDHAIFQPYARMRQISDDLRSNFAGVTFGDARGNILTGGGLGRREAANMASQLGSAGTHDQLWSSTQFADISNMAGRSGLLDGAKSKQLVNQIKSISEQIKLITAISNDPSIQSAMEDLGKMRLAGASTLGGTGSEASTILRGIKSQAAIAGTSYQHMLNGIGLQGQYMYGMNGLTPVLGQLAGATAEAGFYSARRAGLFSDAQFARMGGESGGAQSFVAGKLAGYQTPYSQMAQMNRYMFGSSNNGAVDTLANYGSGVAKAGSMAAIGMQILHGGSMKDLQEKEGFHDIVEQAKNQLRLMGKRPDANGEWNPYEIAAVLKSNGLTKEQIDAIAVNGAKNTDKGSLKQRLEALQTNYDKQMAAGVVQSNEGTGFVARVTRKFTKNWADTVDAFAQVTTIPAMKIGASVGDAGAWTANYFGVGHALDKASYSSVGDAVSQLDKVVGSSDGSLSNLEVVKQAGELIRYYAGNPDKDPSTTLLDMLKSPKYSSLQKAVGGMNPEAAFGKIKDILGFGAGSGALRAAQVYSKGKSANDIAAALGGDALGKGFTPGKGGKGFNQLSLQEMANATENITQLADAQSKEVSNSEDNSGWHKYKEVANNLDDAVVKWDKSLDKFNNIMDGKIPAGGNSITKAWGTLKSEGAKLNPFSSGNTVAVGTN